MRVLTFYIDLDAYRDRVLMLRHAAPLVGRIEVLLGSGDPTEIAALATPHFAPTLLAPRPLDRTAREPALLRAVMARAAEVDIVHDTATHLLACFARLRLMRRRPVLLTSSFAAGYEWYETLRHQHPYASGRYSRLRWTTFLQEKAICKLADAITVFGEGHVPALARCHGVPEARVHSLPNCADAGLFGPRPEDPTGAIHGFGPGVRVLVNVGNLFLYKGTWELLRAFAAVARRHDDARLLLVGAPHPEEDAALRAEPERLGVADRVRFLGKCPRDALPALLSNCEAFVFPSYTEGSPRAMVEAMACGLPIVASDLPGTRTLDPGEAFTRFVPRADVGELSRALLAQLGAPPGERARRSEAARARFLTHHTPEAAALPLVDLYRKLVAK